MKYIIILIIVLIRNLILIEYMARFGNGILMTEIEMDKIELKLID